MIRSIDRLKHRASITIFCALCLSSFILLILILAGLCIENARKLRIEALSDSCLNSILGEYCLSLYEEYGLWYIDATYLNQEPRIENLEQHFKKFFENNCEVFDTKYAPWGRVNLEDMNIEEFQTATASDGASMKAQSTDYIRHKDEFGDLIREVIEAGEGASLMEIGDNPFSVWDGIMETLSGMELPEIEDPKTGKLRIVELSNPADGIYSLKGSDILYSADANLSGISSQGIATATLCSRVGIKNAVGMSIDNEGTVEEFMAYLLDRMGTYHNPKEGHLLNCELEYIIEGSNSDYANLREVINQIYMQRAADNLNLAFSDSSLKAEADMIAREQEICTYAPEFVEPIAMSVVCAAAYLETLSDVECIMKGGKIPFQKSSHGMSIEAVIFGQRYTHFSYEGNSYRQYLVAMLMNMSGALRNQRAMDIMELEIRRVTHNPAFSMDWCIERFRARICANGGLRDEELDRIYGYF